MGSSGRAARRWRSPEADGVGGGGGDDFFFETPASLLDQITITSSTSHLTIDAGSSSTHSEGGLETASLASS